VTRRLVRPASCFCVFEKTNSERKNIMQDDYYNPCDIEALEILRPASDYLLQNEEQRTTGRLAQKKTGHLPLKITT
jgi:hypothetical protein